MNSAAPSETGPRGGFAAFRRRDFTFYWFAQLCQLVPMQMMAVVIGWQVYQITGNPLDLGLIGLAEFLPVPLLVLLAGHASDRFDRRRVIQISDGARLFSPATPANSMRVCRRYPHAERDAKPLRGAPLASGRTVELASRKSGLNP